MLYNESSNESSNDSSNDSSNESSNESLNESSNESSSDSSNYSSNEKFRADKCVDKFKVSLKYSPCLIDTQLIRNVVFNHTITNVEGYMMRRNPIYDQNNKNRTLGKTL